MKEKNVAKVTALTAILSAQAIAISFLESLIPMSAFMPPGAKLGLSNIVTMFCAETLGAGYAFSITIFKSLFAFITRGATAGLMSLAGGITSTILMCLLVKIKRFEVGYIGIAVPSAICHNASQLLVSIFISGTPEIILYSPILLITSVLSGILTGITLKLIVPVLIKQKKYFYKEVG